MLSWWRRFKAALGIGVTSGRRRAGQNFGRSYPDHSLERRTRTPHPRRDQVDGDEGQEDRPEPSRPYEATDWSEWDQKESTTSAANDASRAGGSHGSGGGSPFWGDDKPEKNDGGPAGPGGMILRDPIEQLLKILRAGLGPLLRQEEHHKREFNLSLEHLDVQKEHQKDLKQTKWAAISVAVFTIGDLWIRPAMAWDFT
jgi:hypothetical protein